MLSLLINIINVKLWYYLNLPLIRIQMNIFEFISSDSSGNPSLYLGINHGQRNWAQFRQITHQLLVSKNPTNLIQKGKYLWEQIIKNSPQIIGMSIDYHLFKLSQSLELNIQKQTQKVDQIFDKISVIAKIVVKQIEYIEVFRDENTLKKFRAIIAQILQKMQIKSALCDIFKQVFLYQSKSFQSHCNLILKKELIDFQENVKQYVRSRCEQNTTMANYPKLKECLEHISGLNLLTDYLEPNFNILIEDLKNFIKECVDLSENKEFHRKSLNYQRTFQKSFLNNIISPKIAKDLQPFIQSLDKNTQTLCAKYCCGKILDIILDFPESYPIISSLKQCLHKTQLVHICITQLNELADELARSIEKRLLIPGVITQNILNQYINILKVLQIIDPHGFIFDKITLPIKNYLLKRNDTLRCIISYLTEDVGNYSKLQKIVVRIPSMQRVEGMSSDEDENAAEQWEVLPMKENKGRVRIKYQESDLVSVLVNLYGSQQAFFSEYQNMLAEKLMTAKQYNMEEQNRNLQILKIRFGESAFQACNIIVKDVKDSKKLDKQIQGEKKVQNSPFCLKQMNCLAVSKGYWPINYEAPTFTVPPIFKNIFDEYAERYSKKKAMRKIEYHYNLGHVNLTLTFNNGQFNFKCMPIHAMMITYFDESQIKNVLGVSSEELSSVLKLPQNIVKQKMSFWVHKGVVKENRVPRQGSSLRRINSFEDGEVVYYKPVEEYNNIANDDIEDDLDDLIIKENTSMESHLRHIIEGLIISILNINGPKSPEKIHLLLKTIYKTDLDYTYGETQTFEILKKMTQKKKIFFDGQTYSSKSEA